MDLTLSDDQQAVRAAFAGFFASESPTTVARAVEPLGFDPALWVRLAEMGAPAMGAAEPLGGGAGLSALAVVAEEVGVAIAPVPFVEHTVATRLLAALGATDVLGEGLLDGTAVATVSPRPVQDGRWWLVPAGAVADVVIGLDDDELVEVRSTPPGSGPLNHGSMPIADRSSVEGERKVLATGDAAHEAFERALDEWRTLTAAALVGIAQRALDMAVAYAHERWQFGRPIGAFQAIQQRLADLPALVEGGRLLAHKAAWAGDGGDTGLVDVGNTNTTAFAALAPMAFLFCGDAAAVATDRSLHTHGGYGFAEEYDIQLYYRRARGWSLILDDPAREAARLATTLFGAQQTGGGR